MGEEERFLRPKQDEGQDPGAVVLEAGLLPAAAPLLLVDHLHHHLQGLQDQPHLVVQDHHLVMARDQLEKMIKDRLLDLSHDLDQNLVRDHLQEDEDPEVYPIQDPGPAPVHLDHTPDRDLIHDPEVEALQDILDDLLLLRHEFLKYTLED